MGDSGWCHSDEIKEQFKKLQNLLFSLLAVAARLLDAYFKDRGDSHVQGSGSNSRTARTF
ncbi:hypothetical protein N752_11245 [Desulforamulus aquiferis]|nr:hypothetical protein N752_11245 [Desulforamulus aquiferis]